MDNTSSYNPLIDMTKSKLIFINHVKTIDIITNSVTYECEHRCMWLHNRGYIMMCGLLACIMITLIILIVPWSYSKKFAIKIVILQFKSFSYDDPQIFHVLVCMCNWWSTTTSLKQSCVLNYVQVNNGKSPWSAPIIIINISWLYIFLS
jgi:hypothetical protein